MGRARVCVLGSANMDLVVYAERAPELGETVTGRRFVTVPGGKGANQAIAAARAGGAVTMVGSVGGDPYGRQLRAVLDDAGVDTRALAEVAEATGTAHILVEDGGDNSIVVVPGANGTVHGPAPGLEDALSGAHLLLLQLELPLDAVLAGARAARERGVKVVLTPAPARPLPADLLACVDLLVPNESEARVLTGKDDAESAARALAETVPEVVVTLGADGARWLRRDGAGEHVPAPSVQVRDTTAAGDTFVGTLAVALGEGRPMEQALRWATAAAALSVGQEGASTSMPARARIEEFGAETFGAETFGAESFGAPFDGGASER
ncbi:ribokinase [Actinopolymorpha cephalotaxi]|uniref:Ribokinase n=1 Tax=Actinopolymorpha cephalotaxi TaxID=504797 RepID=A0A1I2TED6_9ACTN|nr:ribokinase [Actinopolymorpha cephalotaxi]NYH83046.1 ribokinase [Actinopolymorpha cephalotaxi]SFG63145.1 ribokinase [Actinopolymorpha cephalotaxi]